MYAGCCPRHWVPPRCGSSSVTRGSARLGRLTAYEIPLRAGEEWRTTDAVDDPHCRYRVDLTDW